MDGQNGARPAGEPEAEDEARFGCADQRRCLATREVLAKGELVRFVLDPENRVTPDLGEKLPGRGVWVRAGRDQILVAEKRRLFARAFKAAVKVPPELADQVTAGLARRALDTLGLALRAGQLICGFDKIAERLDARGRREAVPAIGPVPAALVTATDGSLKGDAAKLRAKARDAVRIVAFGRDELGHALGRDHTVHVWIEPGRLASRFVGDVWRLRGFREVDFATPSTQNKQISSEVASAS